MFKCLKQIAFILGIASCFSIIAPSASYALEGLQLMDRDEFFKSTGADQSVKSAMNMTEGSVFCGSLENVCDPQKVCTKCRYEVVITKGWDWLDWLGIREVTKETHITERPLCLTKMNTNWQNANNHYNKEMLEKEKEPCYQSYTYDSSGLKWVEITTQISFDIEEYGFLTDGKLEGAKSSDAGINPQWGNGKYRVILSGGSPTIAYAGEHYDGCEIMQIKLFNMQKCFFCPLSAMIFKAANTVTSASFNYFKTPFRALIVMFWGVWLAYTTLQYIFSMTKQDAPKFLSMVMKQSFKFLIAFLLLVYSQDVFRMFVVPVLDAGLKLGTAIQTVKLGSIDPYEAGIGLYTIGLEENYFNTRVSSRTLYENIEIYLADLQLRLAYMQVIGSTIFCAGSHLMFHMPSTLDFKGLLVNFQDGLRMMLLGSILTIFSVMLTMAFAFYFLDGLLQLAFIGGMMPLMIAGWPFRVTAQYATTGFKMLLNTFFLFFFTGFVISVDVELINQSIALSQSQKSGSGINNSIGKDGDAQKVSGGFDTIIEAINNQEMEGTKGLRNVTDIGGVGYMLLIFCCVYGFKFVKEVSPLAETLSAGGGVGVASKVGTMAASAAKGVASKATAPVRKAAGDAIKQKVGSGMSKLKNGTGNFLKNSTKGLNNLAQKGANKLASKGKIGKGAGALLSRIGKGVEKVGNATGRGLKESASKDKGGK